MQENVLLRGQCHQAMMLLILCLLLAPRWVGRGTPPAYLATMFFPPSLSLSVCLARHALRRSQRIDLSYIIHGGDV